MHEVSLCAGILRVLREQAESRGYTRVEAVWLEIGELAAVDPEAMRFGFDAVMKGTLADGAALNIIPVAGRAWCPACRKTVPVARRVDPCPGCGAYGLRVTEGDGMQIKELQVR